MQKSLKCDIRVNNTIMHRGMNLLLGGSQCKVFCINKGKYMAELGIHVDKSIFDSKFATLVNLKSLAALFISFPVYINTSPASSASPAPDKCI